MRIVLDANVQVSGIFWSGLPFRVLEIWAAGSVQVLVSAEILREYADTLREIGRHQQASRLAESWTTFVFNHSVLVDVQSSVSICRDPDDNKYLACALDGQASFVVSGDKDLLSLGVFQGIPIVKPRDFIKRAFPNLQG